MISWRSFGHITKSMRISHSYLMEELCTIPASKSVGCLQISCCQYHVIGNIAWGGRPRVPWQRFYNPGDERITTASNTIMSLNWVMLNPNGYPPFHSLPNENILHTTNNNISLSIESGKTLPAGDERKKTFSCPAGTVYLTNLRVSPIRPS
jgi:hypothetical protein